MRVYNFPSFEWFRFLIVCLTTFVIGVSLAWLVCRYNFYMKNIIEWALLLPLALPSYIVAYCYTDFFEYSGVVQTILRDLFNFSSPSDYYFPEISANSIKDEGVDLKATLVIR